MSSPCFDRLRMMYENHFEDFIDSKVKPMYTFPYAAKEIFIARGLALAQKTGRSWRKTARSS